jgi:hypothetical protein
MACDPLSAAIAGVVEIAAAADLAPAPFGQAATYAAVREGWVKKLQPKGLFSAREWQDRFLLVSIPDRRMSYYSSNDERYLHLAALRSPHPRV